MTYLQYDCRPMATAITALFMACMLVSPALAIQADPSTPAPSAGATPEMNAGPAFVIHPLDGADGDYFTIEAKAGSTTNLTVVLGNADDEALSLSTYANDAIPMVNGGFAIAEPEVAPTGTAAWIDYPAETFDFDPQEGIERTFTVTVPADAQPGQYIAGIAMETAEPLEVEGSTLFNQIIRKTIAVFIVVPGAESPAFELGAPALVAGTQQDQIVIPVTNSGNVLVKPSGELTLEDDAGEIVLSAPIAMGSVYAGTTAPLAVGITAGVPQGEYTISVQLNDEATGTTASVERVPMTIVDAGEATTDFSVVGDITLSPDAGSPVFADVVVQITNEGEPVASAEVILDVSRDGELVETFPLTSILALPQGETSVTQRYVPPTGWEPGSWSFVVLLNVVDATTGTATTVATLDTIPPVEVGP